MMIQVSGPMDDPKIKLRMTADDLKRSIFNEDMRYYLIHDIEVLPLSRREEIMDINNWELQDGPDPGYEITPFVFTFKSKHPPIKEEEKLEKFINLLNRTDPEDSQVFRPILKEGMDLLELDEREAARLFDVSVPSVQRWLADDTLPYSVVRKIVYSELLAKVKERKETLYG